VRINEDDQQRDFRTQGAEFDSAKLAEKVRRNMVVFSSATTYLLVKKGWMTKQEAVMEEEENFTSFTRRPRRPGIIT